MADLSEFMTGAPLRRKQDRPTAERVAALEDRTDGMVEWMRIMDTRISGVEAKVERVDEKVDSLGKAHEGHYKDIMDAIGRLATSVSTMTLDVGIMRTNLQNHMDEEEGELREVREAITSHIKDEADKIEIVNQQLKDHEWFFDLAGRVKSYAFNGIAILILVLIVFALFGFFGVYMPISDIAKAVK
jgi:hypothetical protein